MNSIFSLLFTIDSMEVRNINHSSIYVLGSIREKAFFGRLYRGGRGSANSSNCNFPRKSLLVIIMKRVIVKPTHIFPFKWSWNQLKAYQMCTVLILWLRKNCEGYALVNYQLTSYWEYDISYFDPVKKVDSVRWLLINEYELIEDNHLRNLLEIEYNAKIRIMMMWITTVARERLEFIFWRSFLWDFL